MTSFKPTPEQTAIIEHITSRSENLAVIARAGAAKTTTLELAARAHSTPTLYLCFNKKIADEASERMPSHVACRTLNGLGHRAWAQQLNKRLYLEKRKSFDLLKFHILDDFKGEDQELLNEKLRGPPPRNVLREAIRLRPRTAAAGALPARSAPTTSSSQSAARTNSRTSRSNLSKPS